MSRGWVVGVVVAGTAAVALWPVHQRDRVRAAAAAVLRVAATALEVPAAERGLDALRTADAALSARAGVVYRPSGSITLERALVALVIATRRLLPLIELVTEAERSPGADPTPEYAQLSARVATSLATSASVLARGPVATLDVDSLVRARAAHTDALERWAEDVVGRDGAARVVDGFTATFPLRRLSLLALQVAGDADAAARDVVASRAAGRAAVARARSLLRAHSNLRFVRFRNAARAGLGLAIAVLVAKTASVEHAFWVVLGSLSVLRSNALGTGATAVQALSGALMGFGLASLLIGTVGGDDTWLWVALPIVAFLAAYTPGAVDLVVGQAAFTVFVVVLFDILEPGGWRTGLVRVEDVAIGAGISVVVGALLWPRGARGVARRSFAELLRAGADHLAVALGAALRGRPAGPAELAVAADRVADARTRAVAALEDLVLERGGGRVEHMGWGTLLVEATILELAADGVVRAGASGPDAGCPDVDAELAREGRLLTARVGGEADEIVRSGVGSLDVGAVVARPVPELPEPLARCLAGPGPGGLAGALGLVWVHEWLALVADHTS